MSECDIRRPDLTNDSDKETLCEKQANDESHCKAPPESLQLSSAWLDWLNQKQFMK